MRFELLTDFSRFNLNETDDADAITGCQHPPVGTESQAFDRTHMSFNDTHFSSFSGQIPDMDCVIPQCATGMMVGMTRVELIWVSLPKMKRGWESFPAHWQAKNLMIGPKPQEMHVKV